MIKVRNTVIGDGRPRICVPVMGKTEKDILDHVRMAKAAQPDLVEFRCDDYEYSDDPDRLTGLLTQMRKILEETPLLFTFRSEEEGGMRKVTDDQYLQICRTGIRSGAADLIDLEFARYTRVCGSVGNRGILQEAHDRKLAAVMSSHEFSFTPDTEEICRRLGAMDACGADILKIAVMPRTRQDVIRLLEATVRMSEMTEKPLITMSMGKLGVISRIIGAFTGSAVTFASAGEASAPGQIGAERMKALLQMLQSD